MTRNKTAAPFIFFTALTGLFFLPVLLGLRSFSPGDFTLHFAPSSIFLRNELAAGRLPIWNPYAFSGHPFLADPQSAVFYPINLIFTLVSLPWASPTSRMYWLELEAIFHFLLAALFTYAFVWELTKNRLGSLIAGATFVFSGYLTGYPALQLAILRTAIWLPLLLLLLYRAINTQRLKWWLVFTAVYATAYLAGHPQTFLFQTYLLAFWGVFLAFGRIAHGSKRMRMAGKTLLLVCIAFVFFMGLIAAQLLPSLEFLQQSNRADVSYEFLSNGAAPQDFWQFLLPSLWSSFSHFFVGVIAIGLAALASLSALMSITNIKDDDQRRLTTVSLFFTFAAIIALLVSMGKYGPLYAFFYRYAPGWDLFREQERVAYLVSFSLSVLAGMGIAWLHLLSIRQRHWSARLIASALLAGLVAFFYVWKIPLRLALANSEFTIQVLLTGIGIVLLAYIVGTQPKLAWILLLLTIINLFYVDWKTIQSPIPLAEAMSIDPAISALKDASQDCDDDIAPCALDWQGMPGRVFNETALPNGFGAMLSLENVGGTSPIQLQHYVELFEDFPLDRMWQLTGVEHVLTWRAELFEPAERLRSFQDGENTVYLYRLTDRNPRAWFADEIEIMGDEEALQALSTYQLDPATVAILAPDEAHKLSVIPAAGANVQGDIHLQRLSPTKMTINAPPGPEGLLILSENWMPGWQASRVRDVSGHPRQDALPVVRADVTLLGILIPAGGGVIEVNYRPASVRIGTDISLITLTILILVTIAYLSKKQPNHSNKLPHD